MSSRQSSRMHHLKTYFIQRIRRSVRMYFAPVYAVWRLVAWLFRYMVNLTNDYGKR